jgi:hypothetical protein
MNFTLNKKSKKNCCTFWGKPILVKILILFCKQFLVLKKIRNLNKHMPLSLDLDSQKRRLRMETDLAYTTFIFISIKIRLKFFTLFLYEPFYFLSKAMFVFIWLPYAFVCIYRTLWGGSHLSPFLMTLPAMFAKSSMFLPPLFYIIFNKQIQEAFMGLLKIMFVEAYEDYEYGMLLKFFKKWSLEKLSYLLKFIFSK